MGCFRIIYFVKCQKNFLGHLLLFFSHFNVKRLGDYFHAVLSFGIFLMISYIFVTLKGVLQMPFVRAQDQNFRLYYTPWGNLQIGPMVRKYLCINFLSGRGVVVIMISQYYYGQSLFIFDLANRFWKFSGTSKTKTIELNLMIRKLIIINNNNSYIDLRQFMVYGVITWNRFSSLLKPKYSL